MTTHPFKICIFCGSANTKKGDVEKHGTSFAKKMVKESIDLVYGGAKVGLMGLFADTWLKDGGKVYGVIPTALQKKEVAHEGITQLFKVETMHQRKQKMYDLSDLFVTFPGGFGTLDETFEVITWKQIGVNAKPIILLNLDGYYDSLIEFVDHAAKVGMIRAEHRNLFLVASTVEELAVMILEYRDKQALRD